MTTVYQTIALHIRGRDVEVNAEGCVTTGGSNAYGSTDPAWIEIEGMAYTHPVTGKPLSPRLTKLIDKEHGEYIGDVLCDM